ncbi:hypothetical protein WJX74_009813 [Apatococcus lobatus]|uniref:B9 domain-containing protein 1 n=1 Tax=Apatococcus lobatus TaxID=904363 RepID=A0AAW1SA22_9CHLO
MRFEASCRSSCLGPEIPGCKNAYCRYQVLHGEDWERLQGAEHGLTQLARGGRKQELVWNFPLELAYRSTNAHGWPQLIVSVYGFDGWGRDVIRGYGSAYLPTFSGRHKVKMHLFRPQSATTAQAFTGWLWGMQAEYADGAYPGCTEGRELTRTISAGQVNVEMTTMTKDMELYGYSDGAQPVSTRNGPA